MILLRIILDGLVVAAVFNLTVALLWLSVPNAFSKMLPKEIRIVAPKRTKREMKILAVVLYPLYIVIIAYMIISARQAGISEFWDLFWVGYIEMFFVNLGDLIGLDWLFREKYKEKLIIKGTEHCDAWNNEKWMLTLGIPEHCILWPVIVCPFVGFICAGIGTIL